MSASRLPKALDPAQRAAVLTTAPRVLVLAGAGSGKTRTLVHRVVHLVRDRGANPREIVLVTFTQRAAREMQSRAHALLGPAAAALRCGTFHALALRAVRAGSEVLGIDPSFTLLDRDGRRTLLAEALAEAGLDPRDRMTPESFSRWLGRAANDERSLSEVLLQHAPELAPQLGALEAASDAYARAKASARALDFDDLLVLWRLLLDPTTEGYAGAPVSHVLVDEFQDTTAIQAGIAEDLATQGALYVVGDDAQSIYGFRGARFDNILEFPTLAPTEVHRLVTSYRSPPSVIAIARAALELNPLQFPKPLTAARSSGEPVQIVVAEDETDEARRVAHLIEGLADRGVPLTEQAILVRRHRDGAPFELALAERGLPYRVRTGRRFLERPHVGDVVAHLRVASSGADTLAWRRVLALRPGVGPRTVARLAAILEESPPVEADADTIFRQALAPAAPPRAREGIASASALFRRLSAHLPRGVGPAVRAVLDSGDPGIEALLHRSEAPEAARADLERLVALGALPVSEALDAWQVGGLDPDDAPPPGVLIGTIHAAKGLEWTAVFLGGLIEGRFPVEAATRALEEEAEERRLFYVAVTRARRHLFLCRPGQVMTDRGPRLATPSRFIDEIPRDLYAAGLVEAGRAAGAGPGYSGGASEGGPT